MELHLARVSEAAYSGVVALKRLGYQRVSKYRSGRTGTKAYLAINDDKKMAVVVFRGTELQGKDIITDLKVDKDVYKGHRVHKGFLQAYKSVYKLINRDVAMLEDGYSVYITGHSLAGALAYLYCLYNCKDHPSIEGCYTYGQPRTGKGAPLPIVYDRVVLHSDIITRVPVIGYKHAGRCKYITRKGKVVINPSWWRMFKDRVLYLYQGGSDHMIHHYIEAIEKIKPPF